MWAPGVCLKLLWWREWRCCIAKEVCSGHAAMPPQRMVRVGSQYNMSSSVCPSCPQVCSSSYPPCHLAVSEHAASAGGHALPHHPAVGHMDDGAAAAGLRLVGVHPVLAAALPDLQADLGPAGGARPCLPAVLLSWDQHTPPLQAGLLAGSYSRCTAASMPVRLRLDAVLGHS